MKPSCDALSRRRGDVLPPRVSIVVPAHNSESFIDMCLRSIANQTFENFEVIIVNDGSDDGTLECAERWSRRDSRFHVLDLEDPMHHPGIARNRGIQLATGEFLAFVDSDDSWYPTKLETQVRIMEQRRDLALVHSCLLVWVPGRKWLAYTRLIAPYRRKPTLNRLTQVNMIQTSSVLCRRACLETTGAFAEDRKLAGVEDYDLWLRIVEKFNAGYIHEIQGLYRRSPGSLSRMVDEAVAIAWLADIRGIDQTRRHPQIVRSLRSLVELPFSIMQLVFAPWVRRKFRKLPRVE